jgi:hypothetical protein
VELSMSARWYETSPPIHAPPPIGTMPTGHRTCSLLMPTLS